MSVKDLEDRVAFLEASVVHEREQLEKANDAVVSIEGKLEKMRAYAELVVADAEAAVPNAHDEVALIKGRLEATEAELTAVKSELDDTREN